MTGSPNSRYNSFSQPSNTEGRDDDEGSHIRFDTMPPAPMTLGSERTQSTTVRLQRQGLSMVKSRDFAVRSIRRGSDDWNALIKPFVSDLVFRSLVQRRKYQKASFRPYTTYAAVLFVDLSHYSKITAAIAHRGAHFLSCCVNDYLSRLLRIVHEHGGDVVKFAGDAVLIVWEGRQEELAINVLCAARCVLDLQRKEPKYEIEGTDLSFSIHCGLTCGRLESDIFEASSHLHMQRYYHSVGGETMEDITDLVDVALSGEVCVSDECAEYLVEWALFENTPDGYGRLLVDLHLGLDILEKIDSHIESTMSDRMERRNQQVEEDFIHPTVLRFLSHGGLSPTQIAQMRNLCVLFIAMTSSGSWVNWLIEVERVLDRNRCPIVQIIDDDKGVHIVAAVNLYEANPETSLLGLSVCRELKEKQVGCAIGMAMGNTFCGVTGSANVACRWDITGKPAVRAARLMQYALLNDLSFVIDQSVYDDPLAAARMELLDEAISVKGCQDVIPIYTVSDSLDFSAFRVLETEFGGVYDDIVRQVQEVINGPARSAIIVTGPPLAGKKIVCQRAAGFADYVPYLHVCSEEGDMLQLARTIAVWFMYVQNDDVRYLANEVLYHLDLGHWSRAHDECIRLVNLAIEVGLRACFLLDRIQFLDEFSFSLVRECLHNRSPRSSRLSGSRSAGESSSRLSLDDDDDDSRGQICFLGVHVSLYNWMTADEISQHITRSDRRIQVPVMVVGEATEDELRTMFRDTADMEVSQEWIETFRVASGSLAGYFVELAAASRNLSGLLWSQGKQGLGATSEDLILHMPRNSVRLNRQISVWQTSAEVAMRFSQIYDELPPIFQTVTKILTIATRKLFFKLPKVILWETLNDLIAEGVGLDDLNVVLFEFEEMGLVKVETQGTREVVSFQCPAIKDIAMNVCTPVQIESIVSTLLQRLETILWSDFRIPLVVAYLNSMLSDDASRLKDLFQDAYEAIENEKESLSKEDIQRWKEILADEIADAGFDASDILGPEFKVESHTRPTVGSRLPLVKMYVPPVTFGPMSSSISVLTRNTFHEQGTFHGMRPATAQRLRRSMQSAAERYVRQRELLEELLVAYGIESPEAEREEEIRIIRAIQKPAVVLEDVQAKVLLILDELIPNVIEVLRSRLHALAARMRGPEIPEIMITAPKELQLAYEALQAPKNRTDAAQDALMTLATMNWKPRPIPEYIPHLHNQSVGRIRNKVLKRFSAAQMTIYRHQQNIDDFEGFLITTSLFYHAEDTGRL